MIITTSGKIIKAILNQQQIKSFPNNLLYEARKRLLILHNANTLNDLKLPKGNRLERLIGDRSLQHSIRINDKWRVCFRFEEGNAYDVEIIDYHK